MNSKTYEDGLRDGKIATLEQLVSKHDNRLDAHAQRLRWIERVLYVAIGGFTLIQFIPAIKTALIQ